jgi:hypothetical protein
MASTTTFGRRPGATLRAGAGAAGGRMSAGYNNSSSNIYYDDDDVEYYNDDNDGEEDVDTFQNNDPNRTRPARGGALITFDDAFAQALLEKHGDLMDINLSNNGLACIDSIVHFKSLKILNLSKNQLQNIGPLSQLRALIVLDLSYNEM